MPHVIALVDDLMFLSRIREAARATGVEVLSARSTADVVAAARGGGRLVLVDADSTRLPWEQALAALRAEPALAAVPAVAFASHVHPERVAAASAAGASRVLSRGTFVRDLPTLLAAAHPTLSEENQA